MAIGKNKKIIQVIVHENTRHYVDKYCRIFNVSVSEFCNDAIWTKIISLENDESKKRSLSEEVHID